MIYLCVGMSSRSDSCSHGAEKSPDVPGYGWENEKSRPKAALVEGSQVEPIAFCVSRITALLAFSISPRPGFIALKTKSCENGFC